MVLRSASSEMSLSTEISKGGEEIFESVPEESEKSSSTPKAEVETPEIERLSIDVTKAFEVFQGKLYLPGGAGKSTDWEMKMKTRKLSRFLSHPHYYVYYKVLSMIVWTISSKILGV